jgi:UrcA family protein
MFKIISTLAGAATLALATIPMLALASGAHAAPVVVKVSDIDTSSAEGAKVLNQRIDVAAHKLCSQMRPGAISRLSDSACIKGVRAEAVENLAHRDAMMAQARGAQLAQR